MSIKVDMSSADLDRQIELLKFYPEFLEKHFRPTLIADVDLLLAELRPQIPVARVNGGKAARTVKKQVVGKGINLTGRVGWWGRNSAWYINIVDGGAKPHAINSYAPGARAYIKNHPGISARNFMANTFAALQPVIDADMAAASDKVLNELVVP